MVEMLLHFNILILFPITFYVTYFQQLKWSHFKSKLNYHKHLINVKPNFGMFQCLVLIKRQKAWMGSPYQTIGATFNHSPSNKLGFGSLNTLGCDLFMSIKETWNVFWSLYISVQDQFDIFIKYSAQSFSC